MVKKGSYKLIFILQPVLRVTQLQLYRDIDDPTHSLKVHIIYFSSTLVQQTAHQNRWRWNFCPWWELTPSENKGCIPGFPFVVLAPIFLFFYFPPELERQLRDQHEIMPLPNKFSTVFSQFPGENERIKFTRKCSPPEIQSDPSASSLGFIWEHLKTRNTAKEGLFELN